MSEQTTFGAWLRQRRKERDCTQEVLAERVGCSCDMIHKVETGRARPSRALAELLLARLDVPLPEQSGFVAWARGGPAPATGAPGPAGPRAPAAWAEPRTRRAP